VKWIFVPVGANVRRESQCSRRAKWGKQTLRLAINTGSKTFAKPFDIFKWGFAKVSGCLNFQYKISMILSIIMD